MFKVIAFLVFVVLTALLSVWLIENTGFVLVEWLGYEIEFNIIVLAFGLLLFLIVFYQVSKLFHWIRNHKHRSGNKKTIRRYQKALESMNQIMLHIMMDDLNGVKKLMESTKKSLSKKELEFLKTTEAYIAYKHDKIEEALELLEGRLKNTQAKEFFITKRLEELSKKDSRKAFEDLAEKAIVLHPKNSEIYYKIMDFYVDSIKYQEAYNALGSGIKDGTLSRKDGKVQKYVLVLSTLLAQESMKNKEFTSVLKYTNDALDVDKNFVPALYHKAKSLMIEGDDKKALSCLTSSWQKNPHISTGSIYYQIAESKEQSNLFSSIKNLCKQNPESDVSNVLLLKAAVESNKIPEVRDIIHKTMRLISSNILYAISEVLTEYEKGNKGQMEKFLRDNYDSKVKGYDWEFVYDKDLNPEEVFEWK